MDQQQLDKVIQAITEEILGYLGSEKCTDLCGLEIDELVCPGCDQRCAEKCARKTRKVVEAGAARISAGAAVGPIEADIARLIDHTLLKPDATRDDIAKICAEALKFGFASVCVNPWNVPQAAELLRGSEVRVCTVVGFPLGATLPQVKRFEAEESIKLGAQEIDMVINIGALKSGLDRCGRSGYSWRRRCQPSRRRHLQSDSRDVTTDHRGESARFTRGEKCRSGFCEDVDGIQHWRRHGGRCALDARCGR